MSAAKGWRIVDMIRAPAQGSRVVDVSNRVSGNKRRGSAAPSQRCACGREQSGADVHVTLVRQDVEVATGRATAGWRDVCGQ
eukprot:4796590-Pyramimonas_sp.AAC.3